MAAPASQVPARTVPVRTALTVIAVGLATVGALEMLLQLRHIVLWVAIAAVLAVGLAPPVTRVQRWLHLPRAAATLLVFVVVSALAFGAAYVFFRPLVAELQDFINHFPRYVSDARAGRGPVGSLVKHYKLDAWVDRNQDKVQAALKSAEKPALAAAKGLVNTVAALVTIVVLAFLLILEGPRMVENAINALPDASRSRVRAVVKVSARSVSGYLGGTVAISFIAGAVIYLFLLATGVPYRGALALWMGFADLVPIVGVTIGAIPVVVFAFLNSTPIGIGAVAMVLVYQVVEVRFLRRLAFSHSMRLNPLAVAVGILAGLQLFGLLGAVLALPVVSVIKVLGRALVEWRRPDLVEAGLARPVELAEE
ncbi:MAG TPA: AI-2E family transporter [Acidimicrobiales bacterium]